MAASITIYKQDGTRQCEAEIKPRPLADDAKAIASLGVHLEGDGRHERLLIFIPALCGSPTAWANVFAISTKGLTRHQLFKLSSLGFKVWKFEAPPKTSETKTAEAVVADGEDPFPLDFPLAASLLSHGTPPDRIADLVGYHIRVYKTDEIISHDYRLDRVNFEIDPASSRIVRSWFG